MIHLDTSFLVDLLRDAQRKQAGPASRLLVEIADEELTVSVFVVCELMAGVDLSRRPSAERERVADLLEGLEVAYPGTEFATAYGRLFADLERSGQRLAAMDHLIATSALVDGAALATADSDDFSRVPRLDVLSY